MNTPEDTDETTKRKAFHSRLKGFFWAHDPQRVPKVDEILDLHKGHEEAYLQQVHQEWGERDFSGEVAVDDLYEHERYSYLSFSWGSSFPGHLLPTDRRRWSTLHGTPSSQTREKIQPELPLHWEWTSEWHVDPMIGDEQGWIYALDFPMLNLMVKRNRIRTVPKATDYVRRRRWIRHRQRIPSLPPLVPDSPPPLLQEQVIPTPSILHYFTLDMEISMIERAWHQAIENLEVFYTFQKSVQTEEKKKWKRKKQKLRQQIDILDNTILSMQRFIQEEIADGHIQQKLKYAQSKLDALKRIYWHPHEKQYILRFSIDGIFYGVRDFLLESLTTSVQIQISHQTNGASGITPMCKIQFQGHVVCCGSHVKVIGEKGTIIPHTRWDQMYLNTDFKAFIYLIYIPDENNTGKWEFLLNSEATYVELYHFTRKTKGGMDLPEPMVRKLMSDVLSSVLRDLVLQYIPSELALVFERPPGKLDVSGHIKLQGIPIETVMEREMEYMTCASIPTSPLVKMASTTLKSLLGSPTTQEMQEIANLLQLRPAQMNLLIALQHAPLYPTFCTFKSLLSMCRYYKEYLHPMIQKGAIEQVEQFKMAWNHLVELMYLKKIKEESSLITYEWFDMNHVWDRLAYLSQKPIQLEIHIHHFYCTLDTLCMIDAMSHFYQRVILGIDCSKPRTWDQTLYGFRFGRKPRIWNVSPLDPMHMDPIFRSRLKEFHQFCQTLKGMMELIQTNVEEMSLEMIGTLEGTNLDCHLQGTIKEFSFIGPLDVMIQVPVMSLGQYRIQTVAIKENQVGYQLEMFLPGTDQVGFQMILTDCSIDVRLDTNALIQDLQTSRHRAASQITAPWSPSESFTLEHRQETTHQALCLSIHSSTEDKEPILRIPSPSHSPFGMVSITSSPYTKLHVHSKSGSFETSLRPFMDRLIQLIRPLFIASFPEHTGLFDRVYELFWEWISSPSMSLSFQLLIKGFLQILATDTTQRHLFLTFSGIPGTTQPIIYQDEISLVHVIVQTDELVNMWIDDCYPPYASPLYF